MNFIDITSNLHHDVYAAIDPRDALEGSCNGKTVLVTGAGRGIGKTIPLAFAFAGAWTIILVARTISELEQNRREILAQFPGELAPKVITHVTDVSSETSVKALFERLAKDGVRIDILVNNAGVMEHLASIHEGTPAVWGAVWDTNIKGTYHMAHYLLKQVCAGYLQSTAPATIICTSSVGALRTAPGFSAYSPSKTAINRFVEFLHAEYADKGVRAFAYHPGAVDTPLAAQVWTAEQRKVLIDKPELPAAFCVWLASNAEANAFCGKYTSCNWDVDDIVALAKKRGDDPNWLTMKLVV